MTASGFYINLDLRKIEQYARKHGFGGSTWKQDVLADILHDGELLAEKSYDPRDRSKTVWHCLGRRCSLACVPDKSAQDTLFCIGLVGGPDVGGVNPKGREFRVPGPWRVHTFGRRPAPPITVDEHLEKCRAMHQDATGSARGFSNRPFQSLQDVMGAAVGRTTPARREVAREESSLGSSLDCSPEDSTESVSLTTSHGPDPGPRTESVAASGPSVAGDQPPMEVMTIEDDSEAGSAVDAPEEQAVHEDPGSCIEPEVEAEPASTSTENREPPSAEAEGVKAVVLTPPHQTIRDLSDWPGVATAVLVVSRPSLDGLLGVSDPAEARRQRISRLEAEIARLQRELAEVPEEEEILEANDLRAGIASAGETLVTTPPAEILTGSASDLLHVLEALTEAQALPLPAWLLGNGEREGRTAFVLGNHDAQQKLVEALAWVRRTFAGAPPERLSGLPAPGASESVTEWLDEAWRAELDLQEVLHDLPESCAGRLRALPRGEAREVADMLRAWQAALHPAAFDDLAGRFVAGEDCPKLPGLDALADEDVATVRDITTFDRVTRFLAQVTSTASSAPSTRKRSTGRPARVLNFDHVVTNERGNIESAAILVPDQEPGATHTRIELPVRIVADGRIDQDVDVRVYSAAIAAVPKDIYLPEGLSISIEDGKRVLAWRLSADTTRWYPHESNRWAREEILSVPVTLGEAERFRASTGRLSIRLVCPGVSNNLYFESFQTTPPRNTVGTGLGEATASDLVRNQPLGAQVHHQRLEGLVAEGRQSFMVVAPRRFGKTTLFQHLTEVAREGGHEVIDVSLARHMNTDQGASEVWLRIRAVLEQEHHAAPAFGQALPQDLLDRDGWNHVRRFVRGHDRRSLVLLVDEAQVLVPRNGGVRWGNLFKDLADNVLSKAEEGLALVQVVLIGTVDLSIRMGQNCRDFLLMHGSEQHAFEEAQLNRFLRTAGQGSIASTKQARIELARWSNNLRSLTAIFSMARQRLVERQRLFLMDSDVQACIRELLDTDSPLAEELWTYARAELSFQDEWEPVDSFPLALAWSRDEVAELAPLDRLDACMEWINASLAGIGAAGTTSRQRMETCLRDLKARGVLKEDGSFYRPLLRELLRRRQDVLRDDPASHLALLRLSVDAVEWPDEAEERAGGGQATVYVVKRGGRSQAFRTCAMDTDEARRRFSRTCAALRSLRDRRTKLDGDEHLPRVTQAGFREDDSNIGVIVYDWVEGESFEHHWRTLPGPGRSYVVKQVALAVQALHAREVLHCDIAPRNVIINGRLDATLIDFGLARTADSVTHTRLPGDIFKAPELSEDPPAAVKATDVYALGKILLGPSDGDDIADGDLRALARAMAAESAEERPSIEKVNEDLARLVDFEPAFLEQKKSADDIISDTPEWLWEDLFPFSERAALVARRYLAWDTFRAMEVSFLLNNLFCTIVKHGKGAEVAAIAALATSDEVTLASMKGRIGRKTDSRLARWKGPEVRAVGLLRVAWAHPVPRRQRIDEATRELGVRDAEASTAFASAATTVAEMIDDLLAEPSRPISRFVSIFTGEGEKSTPGEQQGGG